MGRQACVIALCSGLFYSGCTASSQAVGPAVRVVATVSVTAISRTLQVRDSIALTASALDAAGAVIDSAFTWSSSDVGVAQVGQNGAVVGISPGTVTISAIAGGHVGTIVLMVNAGPIVMQLTDTTVLFSTFRGAANPPAKNISVFSSAQDRLTGIAIGAVTYAPGTPSGWLTASLASTDAPTTIAISTNISALGFGTFHATVTITSSGPSVTNSPRVVNVTLTILDPSPVIALADSAPAFNAFAGGPNPAKRTIAVTNSGPGSLTDLFVGGTVYAAGAPTGWLTASLSSGTAPAQLTISLTAVSLPEGTYSADVPIISNSSQATIGPRTVHVKMQVVRFVALSGWNVQTCALTSVGAAYCWGTSDDGIGTVSGAYGTVGDGTTIQRLNPVQVVGGQTFSGISVGGAHGGNHSCGVTANGAGYCWGDGKAGQLGSANGPDGVRLAPVIVRGALSFAQIEAGDEQTCGLTLSGTAYCWGLNVYGALGTGDPPITFRYAPAPVFGGLTFTQLSGPARFVCGLTPGGSVYCWGLNDRGQIGDGTTTQRTVPTLVPGIPPLSKISAGEDHACGITAAGDAWCWGANEGGQLGNGLTAGSSTAVAVSGGIKFTQIGAGSPHSCGLAVGGVLYCWGGTWVVGVGTNVDYVAVPTPVLGNLSFAQVHVGYLETCGITTTSQVYCWGSNLYGTLGDGTTVNHFVPMLVRLP